MTDIVKKGRYKGWPRVLAKRAELLRTKVTIANSPPPWYFAGDLYTSHLVTRGGSPIKLERNHLGTFSAVP